MKTIQNARQRLDMIKESMMLTVLTCLWYVPTALFYCRSFLKHELLGPIQDPRRKRLSSNDLSLATSMPGALCLPRLFPQLLHHSSGLV